MARRRHARSDKPAAAEFHQLVNDYGQAFEHKHGRVLPRLRIAASDGMELADVVDIDRPDQRGATMRVARRVDPLLVILDIADRDGPGPTQYLAAEQFRQHCHLANGSAAIVRADLLARVLSLGQASDTQAPILARLDAQRKVRQAWLAIRGRSNDLDVADVVRLVVLGWQSLHAVDKHRHWRNGRSRKLLDVGLVRLADHYRT
jgi:hypothetical protein